ncbi:MAG: J domain-containing protein [Syntrophobacteraceae bacterium]|jgi:DnaJ-domain-containing protein 1
MPKLIRIRIAEIIYQSRYDVPRTVKTGAARVKDSVEISKEAFEKFRAHSRQELYDSQGGRDEQLEKRLKDPELKRNLDVLDLDPGATPGEIRKAYLQAIRKYHPDKSLHLPPELARVAEEKTKQINTAYSILRKV